MVPLFLTTLHFATPPQRVSDTPIEGSGPSATDATVAYRAVLITTKSQSLQNGIARFIIGKGRLDVTALSAEAEGGTVNATLTLDAAARPPHLVANLTFHALDLKHFAASDSLLQETGRFGKSQGKMVGAMRRTEKSFELNASDLIGFLNCRHLASLDRAVAEGELPKPKLWDPLLDLLRERGSIHERNYVEHLVNGGLEAVTIKGTEVTEGAVAETLAAMKAGVQVIVQGALAAEGWVGRADILRRVERPSVIGSWSRLRSPPLADSNFVGTSSPGARYMRLGRIVTAGRESKTIEAGVPRSNGFCTSHGDHRQPQICWPS